MNLYLLEQDECRGWDTYDSCVVAAPDEHAARMIHPNDLVWPDWTSCTWCKTPKSVRVTLIGTAEDGIERGVVIASFKAG